MELQSWYDEGDRNQNVNTGVCQLACSKCQSIVSYLLLQLGHQGKVIFVSLLSRVNFMLGFKSFNNWWKTDNFSEL